MAKTGLSFYKSDTDRYQDRKIRKLIKHCGAIGIAVYDYILNEIYRDRGCFLEWDEDTAFDGAEVFGIKESQVIEIVNYCCAVGLFNKELLANGRILTSKSIQERYTEACTVMKRKNCDVPDFVKIPEETGKIPEESEKTPEHSGIIEKIPEETGKIPEVFNKRTKPNQTERNQTKPNGACVGVALLPFDEDSPVMRRARELIPSLDVQEAFRRFVRHRYDSGHTISEFSVDPHLKKLLAISADPKVQLDAIEASLANDWKSIYPKPKDRESSQSGNSPPKRKLSPEMERLLDRDMKRAMESHETLSESEFEEWQSKLTI